MQGVWSPGHHQQLWALSDKNEPLFYQLQQGQSLGRALLEPAMQSSVRAHLPSYSLALLSLMTVGTQLSQQLWSRPELPEFSPKRQSFPKGQLAQVGGLRTRETQMEKERARYQVLLTIHLERMRGWQVEQKSSIHQKFTLRTDTIHVYYTLFNVYHTFM